MYKFITFGLLFTILVENSVSAPLYQFLPPKDGYVPVYIRIGDTPLDKINPQLAAAFHENGIAGRDLKTDSEFMQSDQPKSSSSTEEKQKQKFVQSEETSISDHSEAVADDDNTSNAKIVDAQVKSAESDQSKSSISDEVKPFEDIPKNADV